MIESEKLAEKLSQYKLAAKGVVEEKKILKKARAKVAAAARAQEIVQRVAEEVQTKAHARIASIVGKCLRAVFSDKAYDFKIDFERKRGKTEARLMFLRDGREVDPMSASGGGVIDVAAFALRLACLLLAMPARRKLLVLDEPFKHLSSNHRPAVRELLHRLADEMGMQFIVVSHSHEFKIGKVVEIEPDVSMP